MAASLPALRTRRRGRAKGRGPGVHGDEGAESISGGRAGKANNSSFPSKCAGEGWSSLPKVNACIYHCRDDLLSRRALLREGGCPIPAFQLPPPPESRAARAPPHFICCLCMPLMSLKMPSAEPCLSASSGWRRTKHLGTALVQERGIRHPLFRSSLPWACGTVFNTCYLLDVCLNTPVLLDPDISLMVFQWL